MEEKRNIQEGRKHAGGNEPNPLWTHDFTIITLGTVVSLIGSAVAGFALGLLVLDYTGSTFMYAFYMVMYNLPKMLAPGLAGPFVDKFSRRKTIYTLDFISALLYGVFAWLIFSGFFNYGFLIAGCLILGTIDSVYQVAFESFFPMLISEGNYTKAYSIQSTLESLTMFMIPVSAFLYNLIGIAPLFLINMASFFIAAVMETRITPIEESYIKKEQEIFNFAQYKKTFQEGVDYLRNEKGLLAITVYFVVTMFSAGAFSTIILPYFKLNFDNGEYLYMLTMGWSTVGRMIGGAIHYKIKYPTDKKFAIAMFVYACISIIDGTVLYMPFAIMAVMCFAEGILGVTSYNIRISATQSYVPDGKKGRFNGIFQMTNMAGLLLGQFLSGVLSELVSERTVVSAFMVLNLLAAIAIIGRNKKYVEKIYNRQA
ncbi:MAG: MFS transporter [Eubacteriales bacterium]|nr:MFS transporter [Eubacteriales bacterium]